MASKAAEILLALNNQIKHVPSEQRASFNSIAQQINATANKKNKNVNNKQQLSSQILVEEQGSSKDAPFNQQMGFEQSHQTPQWLMDMLSKQIGTQIPQKVSETVESILRQRQKNTYESITGEHKNYIQAMLDNSRKRDQTNINAVTNLLAARSNRVEVELKKGSLQIIPDRKISNKKQLELLEKLDLQRMIKIKDGQLRSKLDILHEKMNNFEAAQSWTGPTPAEKTIEEQLNKRIAESVDASNFALDSQKTKIASEYVRYMHQQRKLLQKRKKQRDARYADHEQERQSELHEAMEMKDLAKRQEILQRIDDRRKKRQQEQKQIEQKQNQVRQFLSQFHKKYPLFKQKQKQFEQKYVKPQEKLRQQKLNQIREYRKSMSMNQIKSHQQKYITKLHSDRAKREEEYKMILKSRKAEDQMHLYYRGSSHRRIQKMTKQQQLRDYSLRQASKVKALRMRQYGEVIHSKHKPNIDEEKRQQLMNVIEADIMRKKKAKKIFKQVIDETTKEIKLVLQYEPLPERDFRAQGNKFLQQAKKLRRRKPKETSSQNVQPQQQQNNSPKSDANSIKLLVNSKTERESKLKSIWHVRAKQLQQMAGGEIVDAKIFEYVKHNIQNLDNKAAQKQEMMKRVELTMEEHIQEKGNLDKYYLKSIKQKMKLLQ